MTGDYVISTPERRKTRRRPIYPNNPLRPYRQRDLTAFPDLPDLPGFSTTVNVVYDEVYEALPSINGNITKLSSGDSEQLTPQQQSKLVSIFSEVFSVRTGRTTLCEHHIELIPGAKPVFVVHTVCHLIRLSYLRTKFRVC